MLVPQPWLKLMYGNLLKILKFSYNMGHLDNIRNMTWIFLKSFIEQQTISQIQPGEIWVWPQCQLGGKASSSTLVNWLPRYLQSGLVSLCSTQRLWRNLGSQTSKDDLSCCAQLVVFRGPTTSSSPYPNILLRQAMIFFI